MIRDREPARLDRRHALMALTFIGLAFGLSWAIWIPLALTGSDSSLKDVASFGPAVAALLVALLDPEMRTAWTRRLGRWRIPRHLYGIALFVPPLVCIGAVGLTEVLGVNGLEYNDPSQLYLVAPAFVAVLVLGGPLGEEPGWRGVLQPALGRWFAPCRAGLLVGVVWAAWHLPLLFIPGTPQAQVPVGLYAAFTIGLGVIYGWLADRSGHSVPVAVLLHASSNTAAGVLPVVPGDAGGSLVPFTLVTAVTVSIAVALLVREISDVLATLAGAQDRALEGEIAGPDASATVVWRRSRRSEIGGATPARSDPPSEQWGADRGGPGGFGEQSVSRRDPTRDTS